MSERLSAYETYLRSGQDMLRVAFPYKTDGVGGHVVTATSALGGAALRGLRSVCERRREELCLRGSTVRTHG